MNFPEKKIPINGQPFAAFHLENRHKQHLKCPTNKFTAEIGEVKTQCICRFFTRQKLILQENIFWSGKFIRKLKWKNVWKAKIKRRKNIFTRRFSSEKILAFLFFVSSMIGFLFMIYWEYLFEIWITVVSLISIRWCDRLQHFRRNQRRSISTCLARHKKKKRFRGLVKITESNQRVNQRSGYHRSHWKTRWGKIVLVFTRWKMVCVGGFDENRVQWN